MITFGSMQHQCFGQEGAPPHPAILIATPPPLHKYSQQNIIVTTIHYDHKYMGKDKESRNFILKSSKMVDMVSLNKGTYNYPFLTFTNLYS